jgi:hypothetical protein
MSVDLVSKGRRKSWGETSHPLGEEVPEMGKKHIALVSLMLILSSGLSSDAGSKGRDVRQALESLRSFRFFDLCWILNSAEFEGWLTGHAGFTASARWWSAGKFR